MVDGLASTLRAIQGAPVMPAAPAAPAASFRKSRRPVLDFSGCAMPFPLMCEASAHHAGPGILSRVEAARLDPAVAAIDPARGRMNRQGLRVAPLQRNSQRDEIGPSGHGLHTEA